MSFPRRKSLTHSLTLALLLAATLVAGTADAGKAVAPKLSGLHAHVGKGGTVDLAASTLTTAELAALRPGFENLKPRARTNAE
jgi:hypothetical protein